MIYMGLCCRVLLAIILFFVVCLFTPAFAGNKKMVDKRTVEMDGQNKQMVRQIPNLPKNGTVDAKARVVNEGGSLVFDIYHVKTSVKEESIDFSGKQKKKETNEEIISEPETKEKNSDSDYRHQETESQDISGSRKQENNDDLEGASEQNKEEINTELTSETDIEISDLNEVQPEVTSQDESVPSPDGNVKNETNLNIEKPEEIAKNKVVSDIKEKNEAANSAPAETQQNN